MASVDMQDCPLSGFALDFFHGVADANFETIAICCDGFTVFEFH
jgi:hypothetical protein